MAANQSMKNAQLFIFDFDGVITDTTERKFQAFLGAVDALAPRLHDPLDRALSTDLIGADRGRVAKWVAALAGPDFSEQLFLQKYAGCLALQEHLATATSGVVDFLSTITARAKWMGIVSAAPRVEILRVLAQLAINAEDFRAISGANEGSKRASLEAILAETQVNAADCVFFGDMPSDLKVAEELGVRFYRVESFLGKRCAWPAGNYLTIKDFMQVRIGA